MRAEMQPMTQVSKSKHGNAFLEMCKCRWREFRREPSAFFFVMFMPILWMAILGFAFSGAKKERYGVGWLNVAGEDSGANVIHDTLAKHDQIRLIEGDESALNLSLIRGEILIVLAPPSAGRGWHYKLDATNREATRARTALDDIVQSAAGRQDVLKVAEDYVTVPGTRYIDFLVPGLVALSIMTSSLFGVGATIVVNRRENLLKRYLVTPMQPVAYILSHVVGRSFILAAELAAILIAAFAMFKFDVQGNLLSFVLVAALGAATFTALAMLCGSRTSNMAVMNGMTNLISVPMMIVAGVWFARSNFPDWIAEPAAYLPLTALVEALRRIALEGASLATVAPQIMILFAYLVGATLAARRLFKWY